MNAKTANRPAGLARLAAPALLLSALWGLPTPGGTLPVTIEVRARAVAPGEPVRIDVYAPEPLQTLEGEFLGGPLFLVHSGRRNGAEHWSGWTMVGLDEKPGLTAVEVRGTSASGREVLGTHAVSIEARQFPVEQLAVAPKYVEPPKEARERLAHERRELNAVYASRRGEPPSRAPFVRPVSGEQTSIFGTRRIFNGQPRSPHSGLDLRASTGTPVRCSGPGLVTLAQDLYYSGNTVIVDHGGGLFTIYAHLSEIKVQPGDRADAGQIIGLAGATGRVTGPHLHWGAKIGDRPFDPAALLEPELFR